MTQNDQPAEGTQPLAPATTPEPTPEAPAPHVPPVPEDLPQPKDADVDRAVAPQETSFASPYADSQVGMPEMPDFSQFDLGGLMSQVQAMQAQMETAQSELAAMNLTGTAGGGLVTATMNGSGELTGLVIKPEAVDPDDVETLSDLILAAVRDAHHQLSVAAQAKMGGSFGDFGL